MTSLFIIVIFFSIIWTHGKTTKELEEKLDFLWERYLLLRLYMEYNEQHSDKYPKDYAQALSELKIDFDKLPYYRKKIEDFYFSMKPIWYNLSPKVINELYELDEKRMFTEKTYDNEIKKELEQAIFSSDDAFQVLENKKIDSMRLEKDSLIIAGLSRLRPIQEQYEQFEVEQTNRKITALVNLAHNCIKKELNKEKNNNE